ncbi:hypothetical protein ACFLZY_03070 [Patescibacteria group bacterium]
MKNTKLSLILFLVSIVLLGAGCKSAPQQSPSQPIITPSEATDSKPVDLCDQIPVQNMIGRDILPIADAYSHLDFLGQIFTAADCGQDRINQVFGVENGLYSIGSRIFLRSKPDTILINVLHKIGYSCSATGFDADCQEWQLTESVNVNLLLELEPFSENISGDDCVNCG